VAGKLPWYAFLYRLLGAHGTFWLWIASIAAVWWTAKPALIRSLNRTPKSVAVANVTSEARHFTRWIDVEGVGLELDTRVLKKDEEAAPSLRVHLIVDRDDPAAEYWLEWRSLADDVLEGRAERRAFRERWFMLERAHREGDAAVLAEILPAPEKALLVQHRSEPVLVGDPREPPKVDPDAPLDVQEQQVLAREDFWLEATRAAVDPETEVRGVLIDTPPTVRERVEEELGLQVAPYMLQADRELTEIESYVFGGAAIVLIFLGAGLFGAARVPVEVAGEGDEESTS